MKIIFVDDNHGATKSIVLKGWMRLGLSLWLLGLPVVLGYYGFQLAESRSSQLQRDDAAQARVDGLREQQADLERIRQQTLSQLQAFTSRLSRLQTRLEVLGEVLATVTGHDGHKVGFARHLNPFAGLMAWRGRSNDFATRQGPAGRYGLESGYAHDLALPASPGDVVKNGQVVALAGHSVPEYLFERHKHGRVMDAASYIHRTIR